MAFTDHYYEHFQKTDKLYLTNKKIMKICLIRWKFGCRVSDRNVRIGTEKRQRTAKFESLLMQKRLL